MAEVFFSGLSFPLYFLQTQLVRLLAHWPASNTSHLRNDYTRVAALPDLVRTDLESLRCSDRRENSGEQILDRHYSVLKSICANHCLGIVEAYNMVRLEYNAAKVKTLEMKLAYLRQEVLAQTYTPQVEDTPSQLIKELRSSRVCEAFGSSLTAALYCLYERFLSKLGSNITIRSLPSLSLFN